MEEEPFIWPYIVAILLMGIPFLILEYGVGYNYKSSFAKAIRKINSKWEYIGWFLPVAVFYDYDLLLSYSGLGWNLHYFELLLMVEASDYQYLFHNHLTASLQIPCMDC